ncbi:MAG: 3-methyl-2-oxobutanoate hydroxymethyltransferase [Alphaproteobacteria bacterium]|nr:3-methyl-2-oxobutanoate hydroxymethyltransferase [Alphaproteobacteria bacterium]MCL2505055.1 3-methyl-2-oxobutanoate hydroxymethyltransferase [Alphaproteobacteria bacterium]
MQVTFQDIKKTGINNKPIACITAYTAPMAQIADPLVDIILVGDSLGMTIYGFDSTIPVTIDMMIAHGEAVVRYAKHAMVVVDMSYNTYEHSKEQALENAKKIMEKTKCAAVKLEGGVELAGTIKYLVDNGIPVMGHIGLLPQSVEKMGGYKIQGRNDEGAKKVMNDALAVEKAGAFSIVIEGTIEPVARDITNALKIPTIGIGASPACDGQILVLDDVIGTFTAFSPKFSKRFCDVKPIINAAIAQYAADVKARVFPSEDNCFYPK